MVVVVCVKSPYTGLFRPSCPRHAFERGQAVSDEDDEDDDGDDGEEDDDDDNENGEGWG